MIHIYQQQKVGEGGLFNNWPRDIWIKCGGEKKTKSPKCETLKNRQQRQRGTKDRKVLRDALPKKEMEFGESNHTHTQIKNTEREDWWWIQRRLSMLMADYEEANINTQPRKGVHMCVCVCVRERKKPRKDVDEKRKRNWCGKTGKRKLNWNLKFLSEYLSLSNTQTHTHSLFTTIKGVVYDSGESLLIF